VRWHGIGRGVEAQIGKNGVALACFAVGGLIYAPYPALSATLFHRESPAEVLSQVLAARGALTVLASPLGTALGGPLTAWLGAQRTLLASAAATIASGLAATALMIANRRHAGPRPAGARPRRSTQVRVSSARQT
jgi:predicted MFS family arabinose efflux permease